MECKTPCLLEICIDSFVSAEAAILGGCDRLEVCSALAVGGLSPTIGFVKQIVQLKKKLSAKTDIFVMIRPRVGDFVYSHEEFGCMIDDISAFKSIEGVDGFVFGFLNEDFSLDLEKCQQFSTACKPKSLTFHRAFDCLLATHSLDYAYKAISELEQFGVSRILTSGGNLSAYDGRNTIKALIDYVKNEALQMKIMPGSGVSASNAKDIVFATGCTEIHSSCKMSGKPIDTSNPTAKLISSFGLPLITSSENVSALLSSLNE